MPEQRLEITGLSHRGEGIAEVESRRVLVPYALSGETVLARVEGERGQLVSVETASPDRAESFCRYYGACGGCQFQHLREEPYRAWKRELVQSALNRRGIDFEVGNLVDAHGAGRRRVSLHVRRKKEGIIAGFMAARSHVVQDIESCPILVPALSRAHMVACSLGESLGDCDVALTATLGGIDAAAKAERKIAEREAPKLASLAANLDLARLTVNGDVIATRRPPAITMAGTTVVLPPQSFLQATEKGETALAELVVPAIVKSKIVADLFCGVGPFALRLARTARVQAFDNDKPTIAALKQAAAHGSGLKPVTAELRDLFRAPLVVNELKSFDALVFDPPRAGAEAQCRQIAKSNVKTVIAVSCDPQTFARDAAILIEGGYRLEAVTPVDQFKYSSHVEIVGVLRRT